MTDQPVPWRPLWGRPDPDDYEAMLRDAVLEAEAIDDSDAHTGELHGPSFRRGYAMGLRLAAGLYGMPEGVDPATRARMAPQLPAGPTADAVDEFLAHRERPARPSGGTFNAHMIDALRGPFQQWLATRGLVMAHPPDIENPDAYVVVPAPMRAAVEEQ